MNIIFEKMCELIPFKTCIKERQNEDFLIVANGKLDIVYLNETSKDFYDLCDGVNSISQIRDKMLTLYDISSDVLEDDIVALIRDMQWNDLINLRKGV